MFALLSSLLQFAGKADLGLSQLADRELCDQTVGPERARDILRVRRAVGAAGIAIVAPSVMVGAWATSRIAPLDVGLACSPGSRPWSRLGR